MRDRQEVSRFHFDIALSDFHMNMNNISHSLSTTYANMHWYQISSVAYGSLT
jgi:hypothetical protein